MLPSEKLAMAAHLHVLLRRKTGRVTDTEWMVANADYAAEVVRFARGRAVQDQEPELSDWADKLAHAMGLAAPVPRATGMATAPQPTAPAARDDGRYVGRLR